MIDRVYLDDPLDTASVTLRDEEAHHLGRVRRARPGHRVEVFNGRGRAFLASVTELDRDRVVLRIEGPARADRTAPRPVTLAVCFPRGERLDWLVEKAVEIGVERLIPLRTARTVVDPRPTKLDRLRRLIIEASKQCGRNRLMVIEPPTTWAALVAEDRIDDRLFAHPGAPPVAGLPSPATPALLAIGPEGGLTDDEVAGALARGWQPFGLGATILRVETAALAAAISLHTLAAGASPWPTNP